MHTPALNREPWFALAVLVLFNGGCQLPTIRGCDVVSTSGNSFDLQYSMVIPSDCPVPLTSYGELKFTGASVTDPNGVMEELEVAVYNTNGSFVNSRLVKYRERGDGSRSGIADVVYPAGTAGQKRFANPAPGQPSPFYDDGVFSSGRSGQVLVTGDLRITYKGASVDADIIGPDVPLRNTTATWSATASGGSAPYTYEWYRNGQLVGTGASYTASTGLSEFGMRVQVTDQTWSIRTADYWVDVDGVRVSIEGPGLSYASQGGATWTAAGRGGYLPYSFEWYVEDDTGQLIHLGSGSSFSGYPGQGARILHLVLTDSRGRTYETQREVDGIGSGNGGSCDPVPPAIVCEPD